MSLKDFTSLAKPLAKQAMITAGLEFSALVSSAGLAAAARGGGAIFTLHHVRPDKNYAFRPNEILAITPEFLETTILTLKQLGYDFIAVEDIPARLSSPAGQRPFVAFTLDDGYRDNRDHAAPIFTRHEVPFTIFITKGFTEATHSMWWETLECLVRDNSQFPFDFGGGAEILRTATGSEKRAAFDRVAAWIRSSDEEMAVASLDRVAEHSGIDPLALTRNLTLRAGELRSFAENPLVRYGAHTISHRALKRLDDRQAREEIQQSADAIAAITGKPARTFAYPYGNARAYSAREAAFLAECSIELAVTTRPGVLTARALTDLYALPRISLNGLYQKARYVKALASGIPFSILK
jgi:peptidoglycan/xylan/chitin deacetylase (PgdA/CDA1 family)